VIAIELHSFSIVNATDIAASASRLIVEADMTVEAHKNASDTTRRTPTTAQVAAGSRAEA